jgi:hypothetical protein
MLFSSSCSIWGATDRARQLFDLLLIGEKRSFRRWYRRNLGRHDVAGELMPFHLRETAVIERKLDVGKFRSALIDINVQKRV